MPNDSGVMDNWKQQRTKVSRASDAGEYLPTWQVGNEQRQMSDVRRFSVEGYGRNSLIFACIAEKATSFAPLRSQVIRADGSIVPRHRLAQLLDDPNPTDDGQDFQELLMTQYEASGNAYIEKVRVSSSAERRQMFATFPVQELRPIRPDYVSIVPGTTRDRDVFNVTIGGQIVKRIPRADMIHIHEPLLTNDFYGVSKLVRLVTEGTIDTAMSDFELAFFRNAGVPMGLLAVKGRTTPDDIREIKSRFHAAYNGVRKWFDLLVLNSDQATYTQMGLKQSDMEMEGTRFHVESRICSTYGVPGVIVGARFAMQTPQSVEEAEHQFWAETMVPAAMRFARAFEKHLLPEFAVQADRGATVSYDFSIIRALQEDRSRKLREVVRLVITGGFTVNQALVTLGMAALDGGDFYVRNGNHVIVGQDGTLTPMAPSAQPGGTNPDNPLVGAAALQLEQVLRNAGA